MIHYKQNHFDQYEHNIHAQLLKIFHSVEKRRYINRLGPKIFCQFQKFALIVLCKRSGYSLRRFTSTLLESQWPKWLQLREIPGKSTLHRWLKSYSLADLRELLKYQVPKKALFAIDATGIDSWQRSRHYERRIGESYMPYAKVDLFIDVDSQIICDHAMRIKPRHDTINATAIFKRCRKRGKVVADKGYDSEPLHEVARENGLELYAPVRKSQRKKPKGRFRRLCVEEDDDYPRRNVVESVIHAFKSRFPSLRSKLHYMKKRELAVAVLVYNIEKQLKNGVALILVRIRLALGTRPERKKIYKGATDLASKWKSKFLKKRSSELLLSSTVQTMDCVMQSRKSFGTTRL